MATGDLVHLVLHLAGFSRGGLELGRVWDDGADARVPHERYRRPMDFAARHLAWIRCQLVDFVVGSKPNVGQRAKRQRTGHLENADRFGAA